MHRILLAAALALPALPALAETHAEAMSALTAEVQDTDGASLGTVTVEQTASGMALVSVDLAGLPAGKHGIHLHETGDCSAADFSSAGGHIAGDAQHGVMVDGGPHPGDLPNATVGEDGSLKVSHFAADLDRGMLEDDDGAAFVVHSGADDYTSQPSGESGDRIACGVLETM